MTNQPAEPQTRRRRLWFWVGGAVGVVVVLAASITIGTLLRDSEPDTFTVSGTFMLTDFDGIATYSYNGYEYVDGEDCLGDGGYDDIAPGTQVTVYDNAGTVLALGDLGPGFIHQQSVCAFGVLVEGVPTGLDIYQIEVSHRGKIAFSEEEGRAGDITLALG